MKRLEITVTRTGETILETKGFAGRSCLAATRLFENLLGRKTSDRLTSEFYAAASHSTQERIVARRENA
jgi:hypothetical protein